MDFEIYGLDTEDKEGEPLLYALDSRGYSQVWQAGPAARQELWARLATETPKVVFCLNLQYDLVNLLAETVIDCVQPFCSKRRIIGARMRGAGHVRFVGIERYLPKANLQTMGEWVGVKKWNLPFEDPRRVARDAKIARIVGERIARALDKMDVPLRYSINAGAIAALELDNGGKLAEPHPVSSDYGKEALYGGRTEVFYHGHWDAKKAGSLYYFDFNAAYGRAMLQDLPDYSSCFESRRPETESYIADCTVEVTEALPGIGALPYHLKDTGLVFPLGTMRGTWTNLDLALPGVRVIKYHHVLNFPLQARFLAPIVRRLLPKKTEDPLTRHLKKNIYTGLSGKFAQSNDFTLFVHQEKARPEDYWYGVPFGQWCMVERKGKRPRHSNYVWSAFINAYGRTWQYRLFKTILERNGRILYGDTDSALAYLPTALAAREVQGAQAIPTKRLDIVQAELLSPKVYRLVERDGNVILSTKGVPRRLVMDHIMLGEEVIEGEVPDTFFNLLKGNYAQAGLKNRWRRRQWKFRPYNHSRIFRPSSPWTDPLTLEDGRVKSVRRKKGAGHV